MLMLGISEDSQGSTDSTFHNAHPARPQWRIGNVLSVMGCNVIICKAWLWTIVGATLIAS